MLKALIDSLHKLNDYISNGQYSQSSDPIADFKKIKAELSGRIVAEKLKINENSLNELFRCMTNFNKFQNNEDLIQIASLRLASWLDSLSKSTGTEFSINLIELKSNEQLAIKQVRAFELVLRDFIYAHNGGNREFLSKLDRLINSDVIQKWMSNADDSGVLSGTTFSELSALFLDKRIFVSYDNIFDHDKGLKYDKKKITSLRYFLDDVRHIRNSIAHNKKISNVQVELLNEYYSEIIGRIEKANQSGNTNVNPGIYLDVSEQELNKYISSLKKDIQEIKEGMDNLSKKVDEGFSNVLDDTKEIKEIITSKWVSRKFIVLYSIIILLIIISTYMFNKYISRDVSLKVQFSWVNENVSVPFVDLKKITFKTKSYKKDFFLNSEGIVEINDIPYDNLNEKITLTFDDNRVYQLNSPLIQRDVILPIKLSVRGINKTRFIVRDFSTGRPVPDAKISFSGLTGNSDDFGKAEIEIPNSKLSRYIDVEINADGYEYFKMNNIPVNSDNPIELLIEKI